MKIVIKTITGGVEIMTLLNDASAEDCIEKWREFNDGMYVSHREMPEEAIPTDRTFRGAWTDTTPEAVIDIDAVAAKEILKQGCAVLAKQKRDKIVENISPAEMASWSIKLAEATKYTETEFSGDAPRLSMEADARGISLSELVAKVLAKAEALGTQEAVIAGAKGKHGDQIAAIDTNDLDAILAYDITSGWPE